MSLVPFLLSDLWEDLRTPHSLLDQNFGQQINPEHLVILPRLEQAYRRNADRRQHPLMYYRPWADMLREDDGGVSTVKADKDQFQVVLDVQQFKPEEIDVKVVDNFVVVNAQHEEKRDEHGYIKRSFTRRYMIPEKCDIDQVASKLSSDGILSITVPKKVEAGHQNEKVIKIEHTGKPALKSKPAEKEEAKEGEKKKIEKK